MSRRKPLVVAFKSSVDGAIRGAKELAQSISSVGRNAKNAGDAQRAMGAGAQDASDEAIKAMRALGVKTDAAADKQIANIEKNRDALKKLRQERKISADEYVRSMSTAEARIKRINDSIARDSKTTNQKIAASYKKLGRGIGKGVGVGAAGGAAAVGGATELGGEFIERGTAIRRASIISGESIEDIQAFGYALESVGRGLEDAGDLVKDFNEKLGEGQEVGAGGVVDFIQNVAPRLGLVSKASVQDAEGIKKAVKTIFGDKQGVEAMRLYVKYLDQAGLGQKEFTSYLEAMVSDSTALIPLLRDGGKELDRLMENARASGNLFDRKDLDDAEKLREATAQLRLEWQGLWLDFAGGGLTSSTEWMTDFLQDFRVGLHRIKYTFGMEDSKFHPLLSERSDRSNGSASAAAITPVNLVLDGQAYETYAAPDVADALTKNQSLKKSVRPTGMSRAFR